VKEQVFEMECKMVVEVRTTLVERFMTRVVKVEGLEAKIV